MLTIEQALRRSAVSLGLLALAAGGAAAQGAPNGGTDGSDDAEAPAPTTPEPIEQTTAPSDTTTTQPQTTVDVDVNQPPPPQPTYAPTYTVDDEEYEGDTLAAYGVSVALGGGVEGFASETMSDSTDIGGGWNVRVGLDTPYFVGVEGLYIGSAQGIDMLGLDNDAILVGNGLQGNLRVNLTQMGVQPFAFGGLAWRHYDITNSDFNTSAAEDNDDVLEIPLGVGIGFKYEGLNLDARGEYRFSAYEDLMPSLNDVGDDAGMDRWGVNLNIGYLF